MPAKMQVARPGEPIPPAELVRIGDELADTYQRAQRKIIRELARGDLTDWGRAFRRQQLAQIAGLLDEALGGAGRWAEKYIGALYQWGLSVVDRMLRPGGLSRLAHPGEITPMDLGMTVTHKRAVEVLVENMARSLGEARAYSGQWVESMTARAQRMAGEWAAAGPLERDALAAAWQQQLAIRDATLRAMADAFAQGKTSEQASKAFIKELRKRGVTTFVDAGGKPWKMRHYSQMVARTVAQEAQRHGTQNRLMEAGHDLVQVSDHGDECSICRPWENRVLSLTGRTNGYPTVDEAQDGGLFHPMCVHVVVPFLKAV